MQGFAAVEHGEEFGEAGGSGLGLFRGLKAEEDGVAILAGQLCEEGGGFGVLVEQGLEVGWDG